MLRTVRILLLGVAATVVIISQGKRVLAYWLFRFSPPPPPPHCIFLYTVGDAQLAALFGNAVQAQNCQSWSTWGPCIWLKGDKSRWHRSYFEQVNFCPKKIVYPTTNNHTYREILVKLLKRAKKPPTTNIISSCYPAGPAVESTCSSSWSDVDGARRSATSSAIWGISRRARPRAASAPISNRAAESAIGGTDRKYSIFKPPL